MKNLIPVNINDPATWRFLAGAGNSANFTPEDSAQHVIGLGANGTYCGVFSDYWNINVSQTQHWARFCAEIRRLGGLVHIQMVPWDWGGRVIPKVRDAWQCARDVVNNVDGQQDVYIQWAKNVVTDVKPDVCQILNEVQGDAEYSTGSDQFWLNYIAFCNRYMSEVNAVKPNQKFSISGVPFWNLTEIATKNFTIPSGCELIYDYHYYYAFDGVRPDAAHYGYDVLEQLPYWDNGDVDGIGKQLTYDLWLNGQGWNAGGGGIKALTDQGKKVFFDEQGTHINSLNFGKWMKDAIDFCVANRIGFSYLDNTGTFCFDSVGNILPPTDAEACALAGGIWWFNHSPAAFWNNFTWDLNTIGQKWKELVVKDTPTPVQLPYHDPLTNLNNFQTVNGTWSAQ